MDEVKKQREEFNERLRTRLDGSVPDVVYHYCGPDALLGILRSRQIWLSSMYHQNDRSERMYGLNFNDSMLQTLRAEAGYSRREESKDGLRFMMRTSVELFESSIACFSEHSDQLSQWRAYTPRSGGYSIGFVTKGFQQRSFPNFQRCIYQREEQEELARLFWQAHHTFLDPEFTASALDNERKRGPYRGFMMDALLLTASLKHPSFQEEAEWRLVSRPSRETASEYRVTSGQIVPYFIYSFDEAGPELPIAELVIGPNPEMERTERTTRALLRNSDLSECSVSRSEIPYRTW